MREVPRPNPPQGHVRIRTAAVGICATDLVMIDGNPRVKCPAILGHEWSGVVDAAGTGVDEALLGKACVAENILEDGGEVGFEHYGGYGEFFSTRAENLQLLPEGFDMATAAMVEPLAVCVRAVRRLGPIDSRSVTIIFGDGPIGLLMLVLLRRAGLSLVTLVGGRRGRLALARELGASTVVNYHELEFPEPEAIARKESRGRSRYLWRYSYLVEASGSPAATKLALEMTTTKLALDITDWSRCKILLMGDYGEARADFPWNLLLHHELQIIGSNASAGAWPEAVRLATDQGFPLARLVSARLPAERFAEGVELVRSRTSDVVKVVLEWI
jgi:L-iditol 2-dehydrogenase